MATAVKRNVGTKQALIQKAREIASKSASFNTTKNCVDGDYEFLFFDIDKVSTSQYYVAVFADVKDAENVIRLSLWECQKDTETGKGLFDLPSFDIDDITALFEKEEELQGSWTLEFRDTTLISKKGNEFTHYCVYDATPEEPAPAPAPRGRRTAK